MNTQATASPAVMSMYSYTSTVHSAARPDKGEGHTLTVWMSLGKTAGCGPGCLRGCSGSCQCYLEEEEAAAETQEE